MKAEDKVLKFIDRSSDSDDLEKLGLVIRKVYRESQSDYLSLNQFVTGIYLKLQSSCVDQHYTATGFSRHDAIIQLEAEFPELLLPVA